MKKDNNYEAEECLITYSDDNDEVNVIDAIHSTENLVESDVDLEDTYPLSLPAIELEKETIEENKVGDIDVSVLKEEPVITENNEEPKKEVDDNKKLDQEILSKHKNSDGAVYMTNTTQERIMKEYQEKVNYRLKIFALGLFILLILISIPYFLVKWGIVPLS